MKRENKQILCIGEVLWDVFPDQKKIGGAPVNFAYHVSKLGIESLAISAIGNDKLGDELLYMLDKAGLHYDIGRNEYPTGTVKINLSRNGVPQYEICEPVAWDFIRLNPELEAIARNAYAVCYGSLAQRGILSRESIRQLVQLVPETAYKVFDINLRQQFYSKELISDSLKICNVLKINNEELEIVSDMFGFSGSQDEICRMLINEYKLSLLVLTCGINGSYLYTINQKSFRETPMVKVVDTVGAGDSFTAAIVAGLLKDRLLEETHDMAVRLSAFVCAESGAMPDYHLEDLNEFFNN
ncbi:carbohydrate kinase family protein [Sunxiuqinia sp. A32]|uniref:carbohydrate kinase family protein n=1 Tax=Sunxiuqinia sp. A32 TaxID=3461496 RepID=UPI0040459154